MIILIGGEKGGTGKTTFVTNLAALRKKAGFDVLVVDTDKQESANFWSAIRESNENLERIPCIQKYGNGIVKEVKDLANRYQDIIIDAGGRDSIELRSALAISDKIFIPIQASQFDVWTLTQMNQLINQVKAFNPQIEAYVVINRASPNPSVTEAENASEIITDFENLKFSEIIIKDRIAYRRAASQGLSVTELEPIDKKATYEMQNLYEKVFSK